MRKNNFLSLINLKVKLHRQRLFFIKEHDVGCSIFWTVLTWGHGECYNLGAPWECLNAMRNIRDFSCPNQFHFILFYFIFISFYLSNLKYVFKKYMLINDIFSI